MTDPRLYTITPLQWHEWLVEEHGFTPWLGPQHVRFEQGPYRFLLPHSMADPSWNLHVDVLVSCIPQCLLINDDVDLYDTIYKHALSKNPRQIQEYVECA